MPKQESFFGGPKHDLGPCILIWDTLTGGLNLDLGGWDAVKLTSQIGMVETKESQGGDQPTDMFQSSERWQIGGGMTRTTIDRLEAIGQGYTIERDSAGEVIRLYGSSRLGRRHSDMARQLTAVRIKDGKPAWDDPSMILDCVNAAPRQESLEFTLDATTQMYFATLFELYKHPTFVDHEGRPIYWRTRAETP